MAFEKFVESGRSFRPKLSIRKNGQLGLNLGAVKRFNLEEYQYVVLFFDKDNNRIGMKFTRNEEEGAVKYSVRSKNVSIPAKSFLDFCEIEYRKKVERIEVQYDKDEEMVIAQLPAEDKK